MNSGLFWGRRSFIKRPGRIIHEHHVELPRPRTLKSSFEPQFVNIVHELRDKIFEARA